MKEALVPDMILFVCKEYHMSLPEAMNVVYSSETYRILKEDGGVENINKILREYYPKGTDFREVDQKELNKVQYLINERPRKKLGFSTPKTEFFKRIV